MLTALFERLKELPLEDVMSVMNENDSGCDSSVGTVGCHYRISGKEFLTARNSWISKIVQGRISKTKSQLTVDNLWYSVISIMSKDVIGTIKQTEELFGRDEMKYNISCFIISRVDWMIETLKTILDSISIPSSAAVKIDFSSTELKDFWLSFMGLNDEFCGVFAGAGGGISFLLEDYFLSFYYRLLEHETLRELSKAIDSDSYSSDSYCGDSGTGSGDGNDEEIISKIPFEIPPKIQRIVGILYRNLFYKSSPLNPLIDTAFNWKVFNNSIIHLLQDDPPSLDLWLEDVNPFWVEKFINH